MQFIDHRPIVFFPSDFRIQRRRVDDVIPVETAWHGPEVGRTVEIRDAKIVQVRNDVRRVLKGEGTIKLQAVSGEWYSWHHNLYGK
jgi:hypothetical protein